MYRHYQSKTRPGDQNLQQPPTNIKVLILGTMPGSASGEMRLDQISLATMTPDLSFNKFRTVAGQWAAINVTSWPALGSVVLARRPRTPLLM